MAFTWYAAARYKWKICDRTIYDLPINDKQVLREFKNSLHTPMHAVILASFLYLGFFQNGSWLSFVLSGIGTTIWRRSGTMPRIAPSTSGRCTGFTWSITKAR